MSEFEQEWRRRFEKFANRHELDHLVSGWSLAGLRQRVSVFEELLDRGLFAHGDRLLELGCGAGTYVRLLSKRGHSVVGVDYSLPSLGRAAAADPAGIGRYVAGSADALPFAAGAFRGVVCIGVLQALDHPEAVIGEIARVLGPRGVLLVETLNPWNPLAAALRLAAFTRRQPTRLRYESAGRLAETMARHGLRRAEALRLVLPPKSIPTLVAQLAHPRMRTLLGRTPGVRSVAAHAVWLVGRKA